MKLLFKRNILLCLLVVVVTVSVIISTGIYTPSLDNPWFHLWFNPQIKAYDVCETFNFDAANWTLYLKKPYNNTMENGSCHGLHDSLFKNKAVKWIVYPNNTVKNIGCTNNTPPCMPAAHFDRKRNIRINTPPCCRGKMLFVLKILTAGLQQLEIPHVLIGGGVIGWIRNKQMVPYDQDLDVMINGTYWRTPAMMAFVKNISKKHGFFISWRHDLESFSIDYSKTNDNGIGLWSYRLKEGKIYVPTSVPLLDYYTVNPPRLVNFSGIPTYIPNNPKRYCDDQYGKGKWEQELQCKRTHSSRKCIKRMFTMFNK